MGFNMVSSNFFKSYFIFSKDSKPADYRVLSPFANIVGLSDIEKYAINIIEKNFINSILSLPPVEQKIEMKDVGIFDGNSKRFLNSIFCSFISQKDIISIGNDDLKLSIN